MTEQEIVEELATHATQMAKANGKFPYIILVPSQAGGETIIASSITCSHCITRLFADGIHAVCEQTRHDGEDYDA